MASNSQPSELRDGEVSSDPNQEGISPNDCHDDEQSNQCKVSVDNSLESNAIMDGENKMNIEVSLINTISGNDVLAHTIDSKNDDKGNENMANATISIQNDENKIVADKRENDDVIERCDSESKSPESSDQGVLVTDPQKPSGSQPSDDIMDHEHVKSLPESSKFDPSHSMYYLKRFKWKGEQVQIVTQNENGPCPLLAIANVLVLSNRISIPPMQEYITAYQLMEYIGDYILSSGPKNVDEAIILNYQQNMQDAISIMYKLQTGIDVNVKFTGPRHFELTQESLVFDILNIGLYHGWLIDPQDFQISNAIKNLSYNQLVEKIIKSKDENSSEEMVQEGLLAESFLEQTASQLTYHGLCELNSEIKEEELCVFFRNNHFNTLYKYKGELFLLVTDQGYLNQSKIIWETLAHVDGESQFVNENFYTVGPFTTPQTYPSQPQNPAELTQEDRDYLIALSLQEESHAAGNPAPSSPPQLNMQSNAAPSHQELKDLELAKRLQDEEDRMAREQQQVMQHRISQQQQQQGIRNQQSHGQQMSGQHRVVPNETRAEKCTIL